MDQYYQACGFGDQSSSRKFDGGPKTEGQSINHVYRSHHAQSSHQSLRRSGSQNVRRNGNRQESIHRPQIHHRTWSHVDLLSGETKAIAETANITG